MKSNHEVNKAGLTWFPDLNVDITSIHSRNLLLSSVFGSFSTPTDLDPRWRASGYVDPDGACVATIETATFQLNLAAEPWSAGGIKEVAVHPDWRGKGLFRNLMENALAGLETADTALVLLYAEVPDLYCRFGFQNIAQYAFVGMSPSPTGAATFRPIIDFKTDGPLITRLFAMREALSDESALMAAPAFFFQRLADDPDIELGMIGDDAALIAYEIDGDMLTLVDIVAPTIPSLATILGAMKRSFRTVKTLFPPDKLDWSGTAIADDTGLMVRGKIPTVLTRPFRFPPTTEF